MDRTMKRRVLRVRRDVDGDDLPVPTPTYLSLVLSTYCPCDYRSSDSRTDARIRNRIYLNHPIVHVNSVLQKMCNNPLKVQHKMQLRQLKQAYKTEKRELKQLRKSITGQNEFHPDKTKAAVDVALQDTKQRYKLQKVTLKSEYRSQRKAQRGDSEGGNCCVCCVPRRRYALPESGSAGVPFSMGSVESTTFTREKPKDPPPYA